MILSLLFCDLQYNLPSSVGPRVWLHQKNLFFDMAEAAPYPFTGLLFPLPGAVRDFVLLSLSFAASPNDSRG